MTENKRQEIYNKCFDFMITNDISLYPISLNDLCDILKVELVKLTDITSNLGLENEDIFAIWGNKDGVVASYTNEYDEISYKISYNDKKPVGRIRFTIAEELSHIILGHINDVNFNIFQQNYDEKSYCEFDEEARISAGILLCSPKLYYGTEYTITCDFLTHACNISLKCAEVRCSVFNRFKDEIIRNPLFTHLPTPIICEAV